MKPIPVGQIGRPKTAIALEVVPMTGGAGGSVEARRPRQGGAHQRGPIRDGVGVDGEKFGLVLS
jgi:hypothetical protein